MSRRARRTLAAVVIFYAMLGAGMALQAKWDSDCNATEPGTRWNPELWYCERNPEQ